MIILPELMQVECETADDIVLRWQLSSGHTIEYVQVKTTDGDKKWSLTELFARDSQREGSSICEKSLACDQHGEIAQFRLVTIRNVRKELKPFLLPRAKREPQSTQFDECVQRFAKRYKSIVSPSGRNLEQWAKNLLWEVEADETALRARNLNRLLQLAQSDGVSPTIKVAEAIYTRLVRQAADMADAPVSDCAAKCWARADMIVWWKNELDTVQAANTATLKVYRVGTEGFFSELSQIDESQLLRALYAYDVEYDGDVWRRSELVEYLLAWLPEIAIPGSLLATYDHLTARKLPGDAVRQLESRGMVDIPQLISGLMLHTILRHHFDAEPIACKLFYRVAGAVRSTNAHIVQTTSGDQLWLGRSRLVTVNEHETIVAEVMAELRSAVTQEILKAEREIILQLREPQHLRNDMLENTLASNGKIADLLAVLHLPILVAYDSAVLRKGFRDDYTGLLQAEVLAEYEKLKAELGDDLRRYQISIFLVPVECAATLASEFEGNLRK